MSGRRIHGGRWFGLFMVVVVVLLVLLLFYLSKHSTSGPNPTHPPGLFGLLGSESASQIHA